MDRIRVECNTNEIVVFNNLTRLADRSGCDADLYKFREWIDSYNHAVTQHENEGLLLNIGRNIFDWLNLGQDWLVKYLQNPEYPFLIEFQIPVRSSEAQKAFIEAPWELLADETGHLAKDPDLKFCPIRRIGKKSEQRREEKRREPSKYKMNTVFMAASPRRVQSVLAYEQEEASILSLYSDKSIDMDLFVEESGNLTFLTQLINEVAPVDVVHISCHGNIDYRNSEKPQPYLCLETTTGELDEVTCDRFEQEYS